jgi:hypothetical protein
MESMSTDKIPEIKLITLSNYVRPAVVENKFKNWVLNGKKNYFYQYIIDRFNGSPTNAAIINSYIDLIYGNGLSAKNVLHPDWLKLKAILKPKDIKRIISDFELYGEASIEVIETKGKKLSSISHIPKEKVVPSPVNKDNVIESYWVCDNWADLNRNKPEEIDAFTGKGAKQIFVISPYRAGKKYFSDPDWISGSPYAEMEEEIANLNINSIKNGLSAGYIINVPDGIVLTPEEKDEFEAQIKKKLTGSPNASQFIVSFNGTDAKIEITPFPVNDNIHKQWQWLTDSARQQLLTAHRVTSPMLFGIKDNTGLGNNADELDIAEAQLMKRVVKPKQNYITEALEEILEAYGINLDLHFIPLTENVASPTELSSDFSFLDKYALDPPEGFELATDEEIKEFQLSAKQTSEQDSKIWKIRYAYAKGTSKTPEGDSRAFCNKMMSLSASGKVFRKEDIDLMSMQGVNGQFAHSGGKYSIWLYAGGVNCYHRWERRIFKKRLNNDGTPKGGNAMQQTIEVNVNEARRQGATIPKNSPDVAIAEIDKPNNGRFN